MKRYLRRNRWRGPALALILPTIFAGCATSPALNGTPPLRVDLPSDCERLAQPVPIPDPKLGGNTHLTAAEATAAAAEANKRLVDTGECMANERKDYAKGKR